MSTRTLNEVLGWRPEPPDDAPTGLVGRVRTLLQMPIAELSAADIRLLLGQNIGVDTLLDRALQLLDEDALMATDYYPGDLLHTVLRIPVEHLAANSARGVRIIAIADHGIAAGRVVDESGIPRVSGKIRHAIESEANRVRAFLERTKPPTKDFFE